jgi:dipeptidyl aminopeptidase/acylaminoacyl peptidase
MSTGMRPRNYARVAAEIAFVTAAVLGLSASAGAQDAGKHAITFADMMKMHRVAEPMVSPDGKWVVYTVATPDMDANRNASNIWLVSTESGAPIQLTQSGHDSSPAWSPDGKMIAFLSSRAGESQIYLLSMKGGEAHPWTSISTGVDIVKWSPDGKTLAFTSGVYPDCKDDACNKKRDEEKEKSKVQAHVAEHLLYRHWSHWNEGKRSHLFVVPAPTSLEQRKRPLSLSM